MDPAVAARRVRRAQTRRPLPGTGHAARGARPGRHPETGEPGPDRGAGPPDHGRHPRRRPVRVDPAAPLPHPGPPHRHPAGGHRPVRGEPPQRDLGRRRAARAQDRRPEDLPVRVPGRPLPSGRRRPLGVRRGHRPVGRRAPPGDPGTWTTRGDLRRQRVGVLGRLADPGLRPARDPADPLPPLPAPGPRQDRTLLRDRELPVPHRDHHHQRDHR